MTIMALQWDVKMSAVIVTSSTVFGSGLDAKIL